MIELTNKRTKFSKVYDLENGSHRMVTKTRPMHYDNGGTWEDVSTDINRGRVNKVDYDVSLYGDKIGYSGSDTAGKKIELELDFPYTAPTITGNTALYEDIATDTDFQLTFLPTGIKAEVILKSASATKVLPYRSYREKGAVGSLVHKGADSRSRNAKIAVVEGTTARTDEKTITQTFEDKVMKMNPTTRKREWSTDVTYPVRIDPTSTFGLSADADDGRASGAVYYSVTGSYTYSTTFNNAADRARFGGSTTMVSITRNWKYAGYLRFSVTGIAQGTTINSATLNVYTGKSSGSNVTLRARMNNAADPANPTNAGQVLVPSPLVAGQVTAVVSNAISPLTDKDDYLIKALDMTTQVSARVTASDYTSAHMLFHMDNTDAFSAFRYGEIYNRDWGTTKDAELVIDYAAGSGYKVGGVTNPAKVGGVTPGKVGGVSA